MVILSAKPSIVTSPFFNAVSSRQYVGPSTRIVMVRRGADIAARNTKFP